MVRATFALLASFVNVGAMMVLLVAEYLGVALLFMMTVEMTVMAIFMVAFMMNPAGLNPMQMVHQHTVAIVAGALTFIGLAALALLADWPDDPVAAHVDAVPSTTIEDLGTELLGGSMLVFESAGVTLLATMIGAVILSSRRGRYGPSDEGSTPPPLDPDDPHGRTAEPQPATDQGGHHHHH
ncbi:MAG: NADH-quinone oxidoreductase subunit J [Actinobacteria bacterium]|nr:NADH-quinone oxidoreductase subunit J [Actinomycetota bacterium]